MLLNLRIKRGYTLKELENRSGVKESYISRIERGHQMPSIKTMIMLCATLDGDFDILMEIILEDFERELGKAGIHIEIFYTNYYFNLKKEAVK